MHANPKIVKRQSSYHCLFALLGSALVKAERKMWAKLTPDRIGNPSLPISGKLPRDSMIALNP
jgi:hypothetical protein